MVDAKKRSNVNGGGSYFESSIGSPTVGVKANGVASDDEAGPSGSGFDGMVTYKRRKTVKVMKHGKVLDDSVGHLSGKSMKCFRNLTKCSQKDADSSDDCSLKHKRNIILEQIYQSLDSGGLKKCIQSALVFPPGSCSGSTFKESVRSCENWSKSTSLTETLLDGLQNAAKCNVDLTSSRSVRELNPTTFTEHCNVTFSDIIMSEQFAQLCSLLLKNFEGMNADKLFDFNHIHTKMKEKAYESSPLLFQSDILEIWAKVQKVGSGMIALSRRLSDKTMSSFREQCPQVGSPAHSVSEGAKHEFLMQESDMHTKRELSKACAPDEAHSCRCCRQKANGKNVLVCDSCEEMYHISCIKPAVTEIPTRSWYCANCTAKGAESSHENCIACERLNAYLSPFDGSGGEEELVNNGAREELESPNELAANEGFRRFQNCTVCKTEVSNHEDYRICGHSFCLHKFYHTKCLTIKQLIAHGSCWYCPSCLCRSCLTDIDDDKIVLCDGCDHAFHIYCMQPPLTSIPKGRWFCKKCESGIQRIQKARSLYENIQNATKTRALDGKLNGREALSKSGGVDMLLNAAKTLNYEENLATMSQIASELYKDV